MADGFFILRIYDFKILGTYLSVESVDVGMEVFPQGQPCGESTEQDTQQDDADEDADDEFIVLYEGQFGDALHEAIEQKGQHGVGDQGAEEALRDAAADEGTTDVSRRGAHELHGAHEESFGVDAKAYRVAYQRNGDDEQHDAGHHQREADATHVLVDEADERLLVIDFLDVGVFQQLCLQRHDAVVVGPVGVEAHVDGGQQRVLLVAEPLQEVLAEVFAEATYGLLLGDVFRRLHGGHSVEFALQLEDVGFLHVAVHHDFEADVFLEVVGEFMGMQHEQGEYA